MAVVQQLCMAVRWPFQEFCVAVQWARIAIVHWVRIVAQSQKIHIEKGLCVDVQGSLEDVRWLSLD